MGLRNCLGLSHQQASWPRDSATSLVDKFQVWMLTSQKQKHRKHWPLHLPLVSAALKGLPSARLDAATTSNLNRIPHQLRRLRLAQPCCQARRLEFLAAWRRHCQSDHLVHLVSTATKRLPSSVGMSIPITRTQSGRKIIDRLPRLRVFAPVGVAAVSGDIYSPLGNSTLKIDRSF